MTVNRVALALLAAVALGAAPASVWAADYHHVHITTSSPAKGVEWYAEHMDCQPLADRDDAADCDGVELVFMPQPTTGGSQGTGVNHISFSYPDLAAKMAELEAVGGPRLGRAPAAVRRRLDGPRRPRAVQDRLHLRPVGDADPARGRP